MIRTLLALLALAVAPLAQASSVTTGGYSASSTSDDIALSCKDVSVGASSGLVEATCNDGSGTASTSYDLDNAVYCAPGTWGSVTTMGLHWGTTVYSGEIREWSVTTSSTGTDYIVSGKCYMTGASTADTTTLDLGDTTNGLKNTGGVLGAR